MNLTPYEQLDWNELYIAIGLVCVYATVYFLPRRLEPENVILLFLWGFSIPFLFDFTIGGGLFDYYDVSDSLHYDVFDLVGYFLYAPFSYFFIYFYDRLNINRKTVTIYIITWSLFALGAESVATVIGFIHYKNGYTIWNSLPIYFMVQTATIFYYRWLCSLSKS